MKAGVRVEADAADLCQGFLAGPNEDVLAVVEFGPVEREAAGPATRRLPGFDEVHRSACARKGQGCRQAGPSRAYNHDGRRARAGGHVIPPRGGAVHA